MKKMPLPTEIEKFGVCDTFPNVYYVPNFISEEEERTLFHQVYAAPKPKWTQLSNRRLQNWGGIPHPKGMVPSQMPSWLSLYTTKLGSLGIFGCHQPNHVLVNEYKSGQGIMPHVDGSLFYPVVTTINLNSHTLLDFYHPVNEEGGDNVEDRSLEERYFMSLLLEPRSLNILTDDMYTKYLHGIAERQIDILDDKIVNLDMCSIPRETLRDTPEMVRDTRVSLTIRYVPKVLNVKFKFGK